MPVEKIFKINEYITLKLEAGRTVIYTNDQPFMACKRLLLQIPVDSTYKYDKFDSIDEISEVYNKFLMNGEVYEGLHRINPPSLELIISPEEEFWGHCSNIQTWVEKNYDTRLLHSNLSFPLLKKICDAGDLLAKKVFIEEIILRIKSGYIPVIKYLISEKYIDYFNKDELEIVVNECEDYPQFYCFARFLLEKNSSLEAISYLKKCLEINPRFIDGWNELGYAYIGLEQGHFIEAENSFLKALEIESNSLTALKGLGFTYFMLERLEETKEICEKIIQGRPFEYYSYELLGYVYIKKLEFIKAKKMFLLTVKLNPDRSSGWENLSLIYDKEQKYEKAIKAAEKAIKLDKISCYDSWFYLGHANYKLNKYYKSIKSFEQALRLDYNNAKKWAIIKDSEVLYYLSKAYLKIKNIEQAIVNCRKSLDLNPKFKRCKRLFKQLRKLKSSKEKKKKKIEKSSVIVQELWVFPKNVKNIDFKSENYQVTKTLVEPLTYYKRKHEGSSRYGDYIVEYGISLLENGYINRAGEILNEVWGAENDISMWPYALLQKARIAAILNEFKYSKEFLRRAFRNHPSRGELKEMIKKLPEFHKYKGKPSFGRIINHNYKNEKDFYKYEEEIDCISHVLQKEGQEETQLLNNLIEKIKDLNSIYDEIRINNIEKKFNEEIKNGYRTILKEDLLTLLAKMILNGTINARIKGEYLIFIKKDLKENLEKQRLLKLKDILISRGGDWKIENKQCVFNYEVKVKNNSKFVLTNIQIVLTSNISGLISQSDINLIDSLNPNSFESTIFKFNAKENCVGNGVKGVVFYIDPKGNPQTIPIKPFKIKYACNLLVPKPITEENYERNIQSMQNQKISFDCKLLPEELETKISKKLLHNNFYFIENLKELKSPDFSKLKAYAEGKYDKQDVALSVIMQELAGHTSKLIIKVLSNEEDKINNLLRDIYMKCDAFKSTPNDLASREVICDYCESVVFVTDNNKSKDFILCETCLIEIENLVQSKKFIPRENRDFFITQLGKDEYLNQETKREKKSKKRLEEFYWQNILKELENYDPSILPKDKSDEEKSEKSKNSDKVL